MSKRSFLGNVMNGMCRESKKKATNAMKQTVYLAMWGEEMPGRKRKVKDVSKYGPWD